MTIDELEREVDRLRLLAGEADRECRLALFARNKALNELQEAYRDHEDTHRILRSVRDGIMSTARDADQRHAVELAFALLQGAEGNDAAASAQTVATAFLVAINDLGVSREAHAAYVAALDALSGAP